jgi:predicted dienelactone hydrolase
VRRLIDFLTGTWAFSTAVNQARIGFFGFSRGGYTGLTLIGADADWTFATNFASSIRHGSSARRSSRENFPRRRLHTTAPFFSAETLASINVPVQLWASEYGGDGVVPQDVAEVHEELRTQQDYRVVPNAGHFAFAAPCSVEMSAQAPELCSDVAGFDRFAFHERFNADVVDFFRATLGKSKE